VVRTVHVIRCDQVIRMARGITSRHLVGSGYSVMETLSEFSDAQLVTSIARYSEAALAEIYRRHGGAVYGLARRVLNSVAEAEDVTQEVFLRLWNEPDRFDQAHGRAVDAVRSLTARRRREVRDAHRTATASYDLEHEAWDLALEDRVSKALDELPSEERRAIELAYFKGYTYVEVAESLGEPEGTIKSRIRRGMQHMRVTLIEAGVLGVDQ
jgi:RNA polymerase sigma-70 factor, ECF subfamily